MKKETILLYRIRGTETAKKLQPVLLQMGIRVKSVEPEEYGQPIGSLAGKKESEKKDVEKESEKKEKIEEAFERTTLEDNSIDFVEIDQPMMVMCGFSGSRLEEFLQQMRRAGVPKIDLKAMLTPTNQYWNSWTLFQELRQEHSRMGERMSEQQG